MTVKKFYISLAVPIITFVVGFIMIHNNFGKLSVFGFSGYILCMLSGIAVLTVFVTALVLKNEEKRK